MPPAALPVDEAARLAALRSYDVLDTACESAFDDLARLAADLTGTPIGLVSLVDEGRQWFKAHHGIDIGETPRDQAFCGYTVLGRHPLVVPDTRDDARFVDNPLVTGAPGIRFYAGVPLVNPQGYALGTLCVLDRQPRQMAARDLEILAILSRMVVTTLELRRTLAQMRNLAMTDALTGLANRTAFLGELERAISRHQRTAESFTLLYLDLDGFKRVNDTEGHAAGDEVLQAVATMLSSCLRKEDMAARLGGDEFAAILVLGADTDATASAARIHSAIAQCAPAASRGVTASLGAVRFRRAPESAAHAVGIADGLMYAAKAGGRNGAVCCDYPGPSL